MKFKNLDKMTKAEMKVELEEMRMLLARVEVIMSNEEAQKKKLQEQNILIASFIAGYEKKKNQVESLVDSIEIMKKNPRLLETLDVDLLKTIAFTGAHLN